MGYRFTLEFLVNRASGRIHRKSSDGNDHGELFTPEILPPLSGMCVDPLLINDSKIWMCVE
jgi:hypothetical protein